MERKDIQEFDDFYHFGLDDRVLDGLDAMGFRRPSPVQSAAIPRILEGKDVIACAQTGTGKTAAFVLPVLSELASGEYPEEYVNAVIMAPTRELAQQIDRQIDAFSYFVGASAVPIYGGTGGIEWEQQKRALRMGADMIIATPGRLLSHINLNTVDLSRVSFFVLDEADRMLDMGFFEDIIEVYKLLPRDVQTIMFSATMPEKIRNLAKQITKNPVEVNIAISRPPESIDQSVYFCGEDEKLALLMDIFKKKMPSKAIAFFGSKERVKQAYRLLHSNGFEVAEMHSDLDQERRNEVMLNFKNGRTNIIVATDIISRGIDVDDIQLIVNYDVPSDPEDYVHRIGRTSRGTKLGGSAITLVSNKDKGRFIDIEKFLGYNVVRNELPEGFTVLSAGNTSDKKRLKDKRKHPHNKKDNQSHKLHVEGNQDKPRPKKKKKYNNKKKSNEQNNNNIQPNRPQSSQG